MRKDRAPVRTPRRRSRLGRLAGVSAHARRDRSELAQLAASAPLVRNAMRKAPGAVRAIASTLALVLWLGAAVSSVPANAQTGYPLRPVKIITPLAAGS